MVSSNISDSLSDCDRLRSGCQFRAGTSLSRMQETDCRRIIRGTATDQRTTGISSFCLRI